MLRIKKIKKREAVYDITTAKNHNFFANDILVHNCQEDLTPNIPLKSVDDPEAEIGICVLSAVNMLKIDSDRDHERTCSLVVQMLDNLISNQDYFAPAAAKFATNKRSLGVGVTNLAGWLASHGLNHESGEAPNLIDEFMEKQQYYLLSASCDLAEERGRCNHFDQCKYARGVMPVDRYNRNVDEFVTRKPTMDWDGLRERVAEHGLRNCTVSMQMPCEASSAIQGSTNGMEPIRSLITYKTSKTKTLPVLAPSIKKWKNKYSLAFEMKDNGGLIRCVAALTKWLDMGASGNLYSPHGEIMMTQVVKDILTATKYGWRTFYYHNTDDGDKQAAPEAGCAGGVCSL